MTQKGKAVERPLTPLQQRFVDEYLIDLNATQAAIRAGYSEKGAEVQASRLLRIVKVKAAVDAGLAERKERTQVDSDEVVEFLRDTVRSDMAEYASWGPGGVTLVASEELEPKQTRLVSEVSETEGPKSRTIRFKLHDKMKASELLGRHLGMFKDTVEHKGRIQLDLRAIRDRVEEELDAMASRLLPPGQPSDNGGDPDAE